MCKELNFTMVPTETLKRTSELIKKCKGEYSHLPIYKEILKMDKELNELLEEGGSNDG